MRYATCYGADNLQLSKKPNKTKTRLTSKTLWLSQSRDSNGVAILDGNATKTVSGFTIDVGFTFAGHETEAASTTIWMPHSVCPMGLSAKGRVERIDTFSHRSGCNPCVRCGHRLPR